MVKITYDYKMLWHIFMSYRLTHILRAIPLVKNTYTILETTNESSEKMQRKLLKAIH